MYHCTLCPVGCKPTLNPLSPNIHIQILQTGLYTFPFRISWENLIKDQGILFLVIILLTLITFSLANLWISLGENWCWSLLGLKGIINLFQYVWESLRNYFFNSIFNKKKMDQLQYFTLMCIYFHAWANCQESSPELGIQKLQRYFEMIIALSTLLLIDLRMMSKFYGSSWVGKDSSIRSQTF